jgi:NAD-dependent DNA ligase
MPNEKFKRYVKTEENPKGYKNPRNMVAGLFNRDIPSDALNDVDFVPYGIANDDVDKSVMMDFLGTEHVTIKVGELTEELLDSLYSEWSVKYLIDGIVLDIDSADKRKDLGREENGNPAYMRAIKLPQWGGEQVTGVNDIEVEVSKDGVLAPVGICEPLTFDGVEVTRFSCYNAKYVYDNKISPGSIILLTRSGDVIPKHLETISELEDWRERIGSKFDKCPSCGSITSWDETMTNKVCTNVSCEGRQIKRIVNFFVKFGFEDFGESKIKSLYRIGMTSVVAYLALTTAPDKAKENLSKLEGWGKSSAAKLIDQLVAWRDKEKPLALIMSALNLFYGKIGSSTAQLIFDERDSAKKLTDIEGVGEISAKCFNNALFNWSQNYVQTLPLFGNFYEKTPLVVATSNALEGEVVCCTGCRLSGQEKEAVQLAGGIVKDGWSKAVTTLIVKDNSPKVMGSGKAKKAKASGVRVVTIADFRREVS